MNSVGRYHLFEDSLRSHDTLGRLILARWRNIVHNSIKINVL